MSSRKTKTQTEAQHPPPAEPDAADELLEHEAAIEDREPVNTLTKVEQVREMILRAQIVALTRLRVQISLIGVNQEAIDALQGKAGDRVLARVTDAILRELGHHEALPVDHKDSKTRRAASGY